MEYVRDPGQRVAHALWGGAEGSELANSSLPVLVRGYWKEGARLFALVPSGMTRDEVLRKFTQGNISNQGRFQLHIRKNFWSPWDQTSYETGCPYRGAQSPSLEILITWLNKVWVLRSLVWCHSWPCFEQEVGLWPQNLSKVPQKSLLSPVAFNIFVNNLDNGIKSAIAKFACDTRLGGEICMLRSKAIIHRSLDSLEDGAKKSWR